MGQFDNSLIWLNKTFDETMGLLTEAKSYHAHNFQKQTDHLVPIDRLGATKESLRITSRLSHTMAWLMAEKAILSGEMGRQEFEEKFRPLSEELICIEEDYDPDLYIPKGLNDLLERSHRLFMRAIRLEEMLRFQTSERVIN